MTYFSVPSAFLVWSLLFVSWADWCNNCENLEESANFSPVELYTIYNHIRGVTQDEYELPYSYD